MALGITIPMLQVRNNAVVVYDQMQGNASRLLSIRRSANMKLQTGKRYSGKLSAGARKRLAKACTLLVQSSKAKWIYNEVTKKQQYHRLSFITLTVSDPSKKLTGKEAHKLLLSHFLDWLRRTMHCNTYLWKAELQSNGQIHYHITTPSFINYQAIRDKWNNLQRSAGLLDKYFSEHGHYDANSTDIHEVRAAGDMAGYLLKEIGKQLQNEKSLGGKVWDCSQNLKANSYFTIEMDTHHSSLIQQQVKEGLATQYNGERFSIVKFQQPITERLLKKWEWKQYNVFLSCIRKGSVYEWQREPRAFVNVASL
jgi:hypothetical protein